MPEVGKNGSGAKVETLMIAPPPRSAMIGVTSRIDRITFIRKTSIPVCQSSFVTATIFPLGAPGRNR